MVTKNNNYFMSKDFLTVENHGRSIEIPMCDIILLDKVSRINRIRLLGQRQVIEFNGDLKSINKELDQSFYRVNKSCIVNCDYVTNYIINERRIDLINNECRFVDFWKSKGLKSVLMIL